MPAVYEHDLIVTASEIDALGHANNTAYLLWTQSAATCHSDAQGWTWRRYQERGFAWVVRSHYIEYRAPAFSGDRLVIQTWVADMRRFSSRRKYEIRRPTDGTLVARAETVWVFVDITTGKLLAIPADVSDAFEVVERV